MQNLGIYYFINILKHWKKFLIINLFIVVILSTIIAFILPKWYYSYAIIKPNDESGINIFTAALGAKGLSGIGGNLSIGNLQYSILDYYKSILLSRTTSLKMIDKFALMKIYDQRYIFKTINELQKNTNIQVDNKSNLLIIGVYDKDPLRTKKMVEIYLSILDSLVSNINKQSLKFEFKVIEDRYFQNLNDLNIYEDSLKKFQKKYGVIIPDEQFKITTKSYAEIESQKLLLELMLNNVRKEWGDDSPEVRRINNQLNVINTKISELKNNPIDTTDFKFFLSLRSAPDLIINYTNIYRNIEIQQKLLEILYPIYQQTKIDYEKPTEAFIILDHPFIPEYKEKPKRLIIIITSTLIWFIFNLIYISIVEYLKNIKNAE